MFFTTHNRAHRRRARRLRASTALALFGTALLAQPAAADDTALPRVQALPRADFTGDGLGDVFFRRADSRFYVTNSAGGSTYQYFVMRDYPERDLHKDVIPIGDQDGDANHWPEFLTLSMNGTLTLARNTSENAGAIGAASWSGRGWQIYNKVFSPGDLNGDARADLLARTPNGDLYFYPATGDLSAPFGARTKIASGWQTYDQVVGVSDNNSDGIGDVITRTTGGELYFHAGTGNTAQPFAPAAMVGAGWNLYNQIAGGDDMTGDGNGDLVARTPDGTLYLYQGDGAGRFSTRVLHRNAHNWQEAELIASAGGNSAYGKPGILALDSQGTLYSYRTVNNGLLAARKQVPAPYRCGTGPGTRIALASDLAADGLPDTLILCNNQLTYGSEGQYSVGSGWGVYSALTGPGDLNGDGQGDLLARDTSGALWFYRGIGDYLVTAFAPRVKVGGGWNAYDSIVGAGDYTGDGRTDVVARTPTGTLYLYEGTGNGTALFKTRVKVGDGWQIYSKLAAIGDINGDGKGDLLAADRNGTLYSYSGTGVGTGPATFRPRFKIGGGWNAYRNLY
ncbi:VCBS repeat-containing protein [Streptomyces sp. NPDC002133]|uniref:FG-GAP repeat domain-containing protein n=1 Tax=Streptomyces sp. NPDC002133 TaxID=3154409 RepID=UPI00332D2DC6